MNFRPENAAASAFTAENSAAQTHRFRNVHFADFGVEYRNVKAGGKIAERFCRLNVRNHRPPVALQNPECGDQCGILLSKSVSAFIHQRNAVSVRILRKTDCTAVGGHRFAEFRQIRRHRFRRTAEKTVLFIEQRDDFAAERFQKLFGVIGSDAVAAIRGDFQLRCADGVDINAGADPIRMNFECVVNNSDAPVIGFFHGAVLRLVVGVEQGKLNGHSVFLSPLNKARLVVRRGRGKCRGCR